MSPHGFFLFLTALIFMQVVQTIAQRKKYRCVSEREQERCSFTTRSTTPESAEPAPRRILIRTQNKPKPTAGSRSVIIVRKKQSSDQKTSFPTLTKSLPYVPDDSKLPYPTTKFSTDSFSFLTLPLKFLATLLSPLIIPLAAKHKNASSLPLVNVQVPMTFSMVHSAAPVAGAIGCNPNVVCHTQCGQYTNNPPVPCISTSQPCNSNVITSNIPVPCCTPQPCDGSSTTSTASTTPEGGTPPSANTLLTSTTTTTTYPETTRNPPPPIPPRYCVPGSPDNCTSVVVFLCQLLNEIRCANSTVANCSTPCNLSSMTTAPPTSGSTDESDGNRPTEPTTPSCITPTKPTKIVDDTPSNCTPPEEVLSCLIATGHKTNACKPCPLPHIVVKPKHWLCKHHHAAALCAQHHHGHT